MSDQRPSSNSDRRDPLGFDELLALLIAFSAVGAILWWSIGRTENWASQWLAPQRADQVAPTTDASPEDVAIETAPIAERVDPTPLATPGDPELADLSPRSADSSPVVPIIVAPDIESQSTPATPPAVPTAPLSTTPAIVVPAVSPQAVAGFSDVPADYWAAPFITELNRRGILSGFEDSRFQPDQPVTRAQYAALLENVLLDAKQNQIAFSDIPAGFWGSQAVDKAVQSGFLKGYPDATFQPDQPITKLQLLLSLANGFRLPRPANSDAALEVFQDRAAIPEWAKPAIAAAAQSGVVVNYPDRGQFAPNQAASRAEVAAMLYQALTTTGQLQPIQSNYIVRP